MMNTIILDIKRELNKKECEKQKDIMILSLKKQGYKTNDYLKLINGYYEWCIDFEK